MGDLNIERIPLATHEKILPSKNFPFMPILYLELLENKTKVRKEYLNKYYVPPVAEPVLKSSPRDQSKTTSPPPPLTENKVDEGPNDNEDDDREVTVDSAQSPVSPPHTNKDEDDADPVAEQLDNLLGEDRKEESQPTNDNPPTLLELHQKKKITLNNYSEDDEEAQKERNSVYFKYEVLRRMHPNAHIPEFTMYSDPKLMSQKYEMLTKKLSLESSVENWKRYMIVFVMGCEVLLGKINFDMEGFAQQQIMSMSTYDQLLVEMAEKSYVPSGSSKWSPEIRLLMMLTMNVVLFVVSKMIFKKTGTNLLGTINNVTLRQEERNMKEPGSS
jgi:hypothetical protein